MTWNYQNNGKLKLWTAVISLKSLHHLWECVLLTRCCLEIWGCCIKNVDMWTHGNYLLIDSWDMSQLIMVVRTLDSWWTMVSNILVCITAWLWVVSWSHCVWQCLQCCSCWCWSRLKYHHNHVPANTLIVPQIGPAVITIFTTCVSMLWYSSE